MPVTFSLNGKSLSMEVSPNLTLLDYLRDQGFYSVKHGCDQGECGSCTVLVDDKAQNACLMLVANLDGERIETLENLNQERRIQLIQAAFLDEGAIQCGYCTPAMLLSLESLFRSNANPDEAAIRDALAGIYCRCTGFVKPIAAANKIQAAEVSK